MVTAAVYCGLYSKLLSDFRIKKKKNGKPSSYLFTLFVLFIKHSLSRSPLLITLPSKNNLLA